MLKKFFKTLSKIKVVVITFMILGFGLGYLITAFFINPNFSYYEIEVKSIEPNNYLNYDYFKKVEDTINLDNKTAEKKTTYYIVDLKELTNNMKYRTNSDSYTILIAKKIFPTDPKKDGTLNLGVNRCKKYMNIFLTYKVYDENNNLIDLNLEFVNSNIIYEEAGTNPFLVGGLSALSMLIILSIYAFIISKKEEEKVLEFDNVNLYRTPFHKKYWIDASKFVKKTKDLAIVSILFAMMFACKSIPIPSGFGSLGIGFTYLFFSIITMIYGPICGLFIGALSDILGFFIFPSGTGPFFFGYTLDAMLAGFTYGIAFYKTKVTFSKCLLARLFVNIVINVIFGSLWWKIVYNLDYQAYIDYMSFISLPKNLIYLVPQSILLYIILKAVANPLAAFGLIDEEVKRNIQII